MNLSSKLYLGLLGLSIAASAASLAPQLIDPNDFSKIQLYEQYAASSYCDLQTDGRPNIISCNGANPPNCPLVQNDGSSTTLEFKDVNVTYGGTGYVGLDNVKNLAIVSFRGSSGLFDLLRNLQSLGRMVDYSQFCAGTRGCMGAPGYKTTYNLLKPRITQEINRILANPSTANYTILVTGHSMGGAIAQIAAADLRNLYPKNKVDFASFGQPEVGNEAFVQFVSKQDKVRGRNFRVEHYGDPVPNSFRTLEPAFGYRVVTPGYLIPNTTSGRQVTAQDIQVRRGTNDVNPGVINIIPFNLLTANAHRTYFNQISACGSTPLIPPNIIH